MITTGEATVERPFDWPAIWRPESSVSGAFRTNPAGIDKIRANPLLNPHNRSGGVGRPVYFHLKDDTAFDTAFHCSRIDHESP